MSHEQFEFENDSVLEICNDSVRKFQFLFLFNFCFYSEHWQEPVAVPDLSKTNQLFDFAMAYAKTVAIPDNRSHFQTKM